MASGGGCAVVTAVGEVVSSRIAENWRLDAVHEYWFRNDPIAGAVELPSGDYDVEVAERVEPQCLQHVFPRVENPDAWGTRSCGVFGKSKASPYSGMTSIALIDG